MRLSRLIQTRRDLSVWIMAAYWLLLNIIAIMIWGSFGTVYSNPVGLLTIAAFVFYSKKNKKLNNWLNQRL